jgi:alanine racemase
MRLISRITFLKTLPKGHSVSYGRTFTTEKDTVIATVPVGYADGYSRFLSNRGWASIRGQRVPLIGRVCMDQCMIDVTELEHVEVGDPIVLFGKPSDNVTADDLANLIGTINYEIICSLSSRVPRIYIG